MHGRAKLYIHQCMPTFSFLCRCNDCTAHVPATDAQQRCCASALRQTEAVVRGTRSVATKADGEAADLTAACSSIQRSYKGAPGV